MRNCVQEQPMVNPMIDRQLDSARPEIGKNGITGHQKNKILVAATLD